jgi:hypothetical protein
VIDLVGEIFGKAIFIWSFAVSRKICKNPKEHIQACRTASKKCREHRLARYFSHG